MSVVTMLKGHDLFQALPIEEVEKVSRFSSLKHLEEGERVYEDNAHASHVFVLVEGSIHLQLPASPPEFSMIISQVQPGYFFGVAPLLGSTRYTTTAKCAKPSDILAIEARPFRELLQANPVVGMRVMSAVAQAYADRYIELLKRLQGILKQLPLIG